MAELHNTFLRKNNSILIKELLALANPTVPYIDEFGLCCDQESELRLAHIFKASDLKFAG